MEIRNLYDEMLRAFPDKHLVFGEGFIGARVCLIGEAPGEKEDEAGRPFVGKAGKQLDEFLSISGIRRESVFITNAVKFRPTSEGKKGLVNRTPTKKEIEAFRPFLLKELELLKPEIIVTLGNTPLFAVTGENLRIGDVHGAFLKHGDLTLYPMYHPASVIYNRSLKDTYTADVVRLGEKLK